MDNQDIIDKLWDLKYIGVFPLGYIVLLVPLEIATKEINDHFNITLKPNNLKKILKEEEIQVFGSLEDWVRLKNPEKERKRLEGILVR